MNQAFDQFYGDGDLLRRESDLSHLCFKSRSVLKDEHARRHLTEGLWRRHYMLQTSRIFLREKTRPDRNEPLSCCEVTDASIHLNSYYLNLRGALDNLAWCLKYELQLLPDVDESKAKRLQMCDLFGDRFLADLKAELPELRDLLSAHSDWAKELKRLRDPAAHRIPLYVSPGVFFGSEKVGEFRRIEAQSDLPEEDRGGRSIPEIMWEALRMADYAPIFVNSLHGGLEFRGIAACMSEDHDHYTSIATEVLAALCAGRDGSKSGAST